MFDAVGPSSHAAGRGESGGDPTRTVGHRYRVSHCGPKPGGSEPLSRQPGAATRHLYAACDFGLIAGERHDTHGHSTVKRFQRGPHSPMGYRADRAVKHDTMRRKAAYGGVGCLRETAWDTSRKSRNDVNRLVGQRLQRNTPQPCVGLLDGRCADQHDWFVNVSHPAGHRGRIRLERAGTDEVYRVAPARMRILEWFAADCQHGCPPHQLVHRTNVRHIHGGTNCVDTRQHRPVEKMPYEWANRSVANNAGNSR
ncbi:hypothetical protein A5707_17925 [Mycobacterium kyorinense]|uniref:Uncharacterized protein n=1 Tax=Mycobacterium kyorinense TaxID=487514 RepID=A0A1A2ZCA4_9MYCO|nr:hypothetical protein A5707_17925 [Mycobacterium kyorinense]